MRTQPDAAQLSDDPAQLRADRRDRPGPALLPAAHPGGLARRPGRRSPRARGSRGAASSGCPGPTRATPSCSPTPSSRTVSSSPRGITAEDALVGCCAVASRRAALFGRAPVAKDIELALVLFGFLGGAPDDLCVAGAAVPGGRPPLRPAARHRGGRPRGDPAPHPDDVRDRLADWRSMLGRRSRSDRVLSHDAPDPWPCRQAEVSARGFTFDAVETGPADGRPVLFLHGFPQTSFSWHHQLEAVGAAGYRGLAFDQRGTRPGPGPPTSTTTASTSSSATSSPSPTAGAWTASTSSATTGVRWWPGSWPALIPTGSARSRRCRCPIPGAFAAACVRRWHR